MSHANTLKHLAALLLAGAALVGCGGADAEPPPPPVGPPAAGPDTTAPTVAIANDVSAPAATGPVTFSFVFSEDVGTSFDGTDITVGGGSAGAFTRVDGRQATLVVTPTPGVAGTITVGVAAARFTDIAGNANAAAASGSKDYVVAPPPPPPPTTGTVLANFDSINPPFGAFEGAEGSAIEAGPAGGSGNALKVLRNGGQPFALAILTLPSAIPLEATRKTISARVNSPTAGIRMVLKLEGPGGVNSGDVDANEAVVVGWQTLTWTINTVNTNYNLVILLPNLGTVDAPPGKAYYFDDIQLLGTASGGGGSGTVLANFDAINPPFGAFEGAEGSAIEAGPAGGSGNALKVLRNGGQPFALAIITLPIAIPLEATRKTISARVNSPTAGIRMVLKLEGPGGVNSGDVDANEAVVVGWQTLTWTINTVNTNYNLVILLPNLGTVDAPPGKAYYFDDIQLLGTASGGGGGGGGLLTFSSGFATGNRTVEGGEFGGFSGSNLDGFNCSGDPNWCGSGGSFTPVAAAADSSFFYYYQTPTPATALYMGIFVLAPGLSGGLSPTVDSTGIQINGQTSIQFKLGQNPEWFGTATNKFAVDLTLGKRYPPNGTTCRLQLRTIVTPTAAAATQYTVPLSAFSVVQDCGVGGLTLASALAASPISQVSFQGVGGSNALTAGGQTSGANLSVAVGGVYPTTLNLVGGISFQP
jgi:Bacterial Ig-like domain